MSFRNSDDRDHLVCDECGEEFLRWRAHDCEVVAYWDWLDSQSGEIELWTIG
jgi:hypothetical protein